MTPQARRAEIAKRLTNKLLRQVHINCKCWGDCSCDACCNSSKWLQAFFIKQFDAELSRLTAQVEGIRVDTIIECARMAYGYGRDVHAGRMYADRIGGLIGALAARPRADAK